MLDSHLESSLDQLDLHASIEKSSPESSARERGNTNHSVFHLQSMDVLAISLNKICCKRKKKYLCYFLTVCKILL